MNRFAKFLLISVIVGVSLFAYSDTETSRRLDALDVYQSQVRAKTTGVYEIGSNLYVHVRIPAKAHQLPNQLLAQAIFKAKDQLQKWALDYTAPLRATGTVASAGHKLAAAVLDSGNPQWRFGEKIELNGQEISGRDSGCFYYGQIYQRDEVVKRIPDSYCRPLPSIGLITRSLQKMVPMMRKADAARFYSDCGIMDLNQQGTAIPEAKAEYEAINKKLAVYLNDGALPKTIRQRAQKLRELERVETWTEHPGANDEKTTEAVSAVTNVIPVVKVITNRIERAQTPEERKIAVAEQGRVKEETRVSDEMEVVETRTVTVVTVTKKLRRKTVKMVSGNPRFEELFLAGGALGNQKVDPTDTGKAAAEAFLGGTMQMAQINETVAAALCENPGDARMWNMNGSCLLRQNDLLGALVCFRCALKLDGGEQFTLANLMKVYERLECPALARGVGVLLRGIAVDDWCMNVADGLFK